MAFKIQGFGGFDAEKRVATPIVEDQTNAVAPRKSVVQVRFPGKGMALSYYNDLFDLKLGDLVYVDGKLEGQLGRVVEINYNFKIVASPKSLFSDAGHTLRNIYAGQTAASLKSTFSDAGHTLRNVYAGQTAAPVKSRSSAVCHTLRNVYACQTFTMRECTPTNCGDAIGNYYACQIFAT